MTEGRTAEHVLLVVEDDPAHAELIELGFRGSGWELRTRASLDGARQELRAGPVDLVLADLNLPDGDAIALCDAGPPVVIMTSHGDEDRAVAALRAGALNYVVKTPESLRSMPTLVQQALREWMLVLAKREAEAEARRKSAELERNNRRLRAVLAQVTDLPKVDTPRGALELIGTIVSEQLGARQSLRETEAPQRGVRHTSAFEVDVHVPRRGEGPGFVLTLARAEHAFDGSELALVELAAELAREKVHALETSRELEASQRKLHQDDKMRLVGQLAGGVAHDFNNMLGTIVGAASVLQHDLDAEDGEVRENLALILDVAGHASKLTRRLLTFSRGGSIVRREARVEELFAQLSAMLGHSLPDAIELTLEVHGDPRVVCDPSLLQTALLNLCINARDAMPGGGALTVRARPTELDADFVQRHGFVAPPGAFVEFLVRDTGTGMDATTLARAFEPFFSTKDALTGSGLGLPVVLGMFEDGGGGVRIQSEPGRGTSVLGYLPAAAPDAVAPTRRSDAPERARTEPLTLLVVDDNVGMLRTTKRLLQRSGHSVVCTDAPEEALELAREGRFDLLLVDVVMPRMDGVELVRRLFEAGMRSRVLYTSGYSPDRAGLFSMAADPRVSFLPKPFTWRELVDAVDAAWARGR